MGSEPTFWLADEEERFGGSVLLLKNKPHYRTFNYVPILGSKHTHYLDRQMLASIEKTKALLCDAKLTWEVRLVIRKWRPTDGREFTPFFSGLMCKDTY